MSLSHDRIMQLGLGYWASRTFLSAVELGLFTALAAGPLPYESLRTALGLHPRSARDFFDALVSLGMLERDGDVYRNTPENDLFLDRNKPSYIGGILEMAASRLWRSWEGLTASLRSGQPQNESARGVDVFAALYASPEMLKTFLSAMTGISKGSGMALAQKFPWQDYKTFVDVGCAQGGVPVEIARAHPHLRGQGFDLEQVRPIFEEYVAAAGLQDRLTFHPGDFFKDPLPPTDVIVMGHILHDWDLEQKKMLVRKAYEALSDGGSYIVYEMIIDDERRTHTMGFMMSLNMLVETPGGYDFTGCECCSWMREAGFRETRVEPLIGPHSMVIGVK